MVQASTLVSSLIGMAPVSQRLALFQYWNDLSDERRVVETTETRDIYHLGLEF